MSVRGLFRSIVGPIIGPYVNGIMAGDVSVIVYPMTWGDSTGITWGDGTIVSWAT